jgi:deoxyribonuclease-4
MPAKKTAPATKPSTRKPASPKAPPIDAPIVVDAGDWTRDGAPLGAHVSIAGGTWEAAARAREISATGAQVFTKQANRWAEREIEAEEAQRFRAAMAETQVRWICAHDSYLINLASPDAELRARSIESFRAELRRCHALGLDAVVSHPGNFMDDRASGIARNADGIVQALEAEGGPTKLLMELTAGQGTVLGSTFEEMADLLSRIPAPLRARVGVCLDTAHVWAAGYDLVSDYDGVWQRFGDVIGFEQLGCLHLNDSKAKLGSHLDRHEHAPGPCAPYHRDAQRRYARRTRRAHAPDPARLHQLRSRALALGTAPRTGVRRPRAIRHAIRGARRLSRRGKKGRFPMSG